ncbi:hypothetical protein Poly41_71340 [Novipirellula artificiosorum]|uniref:Uncharacterized protein n=1 Tax=Novipirellula artificiosorum TaxID=2528016 RepID=A0A5C6CED8_9BACT|nr:hypothetical protein Poly41_71340 [Novipirellula artificiosorum]
MNPGDGSKEFEQNRRKPPVNVDETVWRREGLVQKGEFLRLPPFIERLDRQV